MKIEVTQEDIAKGVRGNCCKCPVALAIRRHDNEAQVGWNNVYIKDVSISLPAEVSQFIKDFDFDEDVEPFSFDLEIPCKSV